MTAERKADTCMCGHPASDHAVFIDGEYVYRGECQRVDCGDDVTASCELYVLGTAERKTEGPIRRRAVTTPDTSAPEMPPHHYEEGFVVIETTLTGDTGARIEAMRHAGIQMLGEGGFLGDVRVTILAKGQVRRNG